MSKEGTRAEWWWVSDHPRRAREQDSFLPSKETRIGIERSRKEPLRHRSGAHRGLGRKRVRTRWRAKKQAVGGGGGGFGSLGRRRRRRRRHRRAPPACLARSSSRSPCFDRKHHDSAFASPKGRLRKAGACLMRRRLPSIDKEEGPPPPPIDGKSIAG